MGGRDCVWTGEPPPLPAFLAELHLKISNSLLPVVVGGDFNLIRSPDEKNNDQINFPGMQLFNDWIAELGLRELDRTGARFTWTNRQVDPTQSVLDRVLVSLEWELCCPWLRFVRLPGSGLTTSL